MIDAADQIGNGIQIRDMQTGVITPLETNTAFYERMSWTEEGDALILFKGKDDRQYRERLFGIVGYKGFDKGTPARVAYDPTEDKSLPAEMGISSNRAPQWTEARDAFIFGIAKLTKVPPPAARGGGAGAGAAGDAGAAPAAQGRGAGAAQAADDDATAERPNLVIWHYKDPRLQTQQQVQEASDRAINYVTMYRPDDKKVVRLADEEVPSIAVNARTRWAIGTSNSAYELQGNLDGQQLPGRLRRRHEDRRAEGHQEETALGQWRVAGRQQVSLLREPALLGVRRGFRRGAQHHAGTADELHRHGRRPQRRRSADQRARVDVGQRLRAAVGRWDIWKVPVAAGQPAVNLTVNGKKDKIRYQTRLRIDPQERGADMSKRQYFSVMAEMTKKSGYGVLEPGTTGLKMLLWDDASIGSLQKAEKSDVWIYRRETPTEAPAIYVTDASLANGRKIVDTSAEADAVPVDVGRAVADVHQQPPRSEEARAAPGLALPARELREGQAVSDGRLHLREADAGPQPVRPADGERLQPPGLHEQRLRRAAARHHATT